MYSTLHPVTRSRGLPDSLPVLAIDAKRGLAVILHSCLDAWLAARIYEIEGSQTLPSSEQNTPAVGPAKPEEGGAIARRLQPGDGASTIRVT